MAINGNDIGASKRNDSLYHSVSHGHGGSLGGMTNGLGGKTNGLTNGLGGRTNGMTNGLGGKTNGLTNGLGGKTNGLTNGMTNGMGGGPGFHYRKLDDRAISPSRISFVIIIAFIIMVPTSFFFLAYHEPVYTGIRVDGSFTDWEGAVIYTNGNSNPVSGLDIVECAAERGDTGDKVFLYAKAGSAWMASSEVDSLFAFIDSDGNTATGYGVGCMGAEYAVEVYGWNGSIQGRQFGAFGGQDRQNWSAWSWHGTSAAISGDRMEIEVPGLAMPQNTNHGVLFMTKRGDRVAETCEAAICVGKGALVVEQKPLDVSGIAVDGHVMDIVLTARGMAVDVTGIDFLSTGGTPTVTGLPVQVPAGQTVTLQVSMALSGVANGTLLSANISSVACTGKSRVIGTGLAAYAHAAPSGIAIDGAFGDWHANVQSMSADPDDADNPNIDIRAHAAVNSTSEAFFYMSVGSDGRMMAGGIVPHAWNKPTPSQGGQPGTPGTPTPLKRVGGEDITRIYIDTVNGGQNIGGIAADYMVEIAGKNGRITSKALYSLPRTFKANIDAANRGPEMEAGVSLADIGFTGSMQYVIQSTDWREGMDVTQVGSGVNMTRGTRGVLDPDWGDETTNTAVCTALGGQFSPQAISDGQSGTIIAWTDSRAGTDIYAQRLNAAGVVQWSPGGVAICTISGIHYAPVLASDGNGGAIIAWMDQRSSPDNIYAQRLNSAGVIQWAVDGVPICTASGTQRSLCILSDAQGGAIVAWEDNRNGDYDIYAQVIKNDGTVSWAADGVPICTASSDQTALDIISDGQGGALISWEDSRNGNYDVFAQRVKPDGAVDWAADGIAICTDAEWQQQPRLSEDGQGGAILVWRDYRFADFNIYAQRISSSGLAYWASNGVLVCNVTGQQNAPEIVPDGLGGAIITWADSRGVSRDVYAQRINYLGNIQWIENGVAICTQSDNQWYPILVPDGQGGAIVCWYDSRNGDLDIYAQRVNANGVSLWERYGIAVSTALNDQYNPQIVIDSRFLLGNQQLQSSPNSVNEFKGIIVVWEDYRNNAVSGGDIYAQAINEDGKEFVERHALDPIWGSMTICAAPELQQEVQVVMDGQGGAIFVWTDNRNDATTANDIYAQRVRADGIFMWGTGVGVCTELTDQLSARAVPDGQGGVIIAWYDNRDLGSGDVDIYAQRLDADGIPVWAANGVPACTSTDYEQQPQLVPDGQGGAIVSWMDFRGSPRRIYAQRLDPVAGAMMWDPLGVPMSTTLEYAYDHTMVQDGKGGAIIAWRDWGPTTYDIFAQRVSASGTVEWAPEGVTVCGADYDQYYPHMIQDGQGGAIIAWDDYRLDCANDMVYAQRLNAQGTVMWTANGVAVCTELGTDVYYCFPQLTPDGQGGAIIVWEDYRNEATLGSDIYGQRLDTDGQALWDAGGNLLGTGVHYEYFADLVPDGNGGALVVFNDWEAAEWRLQHVADDGATDYGSNGILLSSDTFDPSRPKLAIDGSGGAILAWADDKDEGVPEHDIYAQRIALAESTVVINEVMFDPSSGDDWVELANPTLVSYDISGWKLIDDSDTVIHTFPASTTLAAGAYLVPVALDIPNTLGNIDALALVDADGAMRDYVAWGAVPTGDNYTAAVASENWYSGTYMDTTGFVQGNTLGRDRYETDTDTVADWEITCGIDTNIPTPEYTNVPEFRTIMVPVFMMLGTVFFFRRKTNRGSV